MKYDMCKTPIHETNQENINDLLEYGPEIDYDILRDSDNKPSATGETDQLVYKQ